MDFRTTATGAEQLEPFIVSLGFGEVAANQLVEALRTALTEDERG